jgi:hypothetical protein
MSACQQFCLKKWKLPVFTVKVWNSLRCGAGKKLLNIIHHINAVATFIRLRFKKVTIMLAATQTVRSLTFLRPSGLFGVGLIAGFAIGFAVLIIAA